MYSKCTESEEKLADSCPLIKLNSAFFFLILGNRKVIHSDKQTYMAGLEIAGSKYKACIGENHLSSKAFSKRKLNRLSLKKPKSFYNIEGNVIEPFLECKISPTVDHYVS